MVQKTTKNTIDIEVPVGQLVAIASFGDGITRIYTETQNTGMLSSFTLEETIQRDQTTLKAFTRTRKVRIEPNGSPVTYDIGLAPKITSRVGGELDSKVDGNFNINTENGADSGTTDPASGGTIVTITSGNGGANTAGETTGDGGDGGSFTINAGDGGDTSSIANGAPGDGASIFINAGVGGSASAGDADGGDGGVIQLNTGGAGSSSGGSSGKPGFVTVYGTSAGDSPVFFSMNEDTVDDAGTVTVAQHRGQILLSDTDSGDTTMTTATAANLNTAFPGLSTGATMLQFIRGTDSSNVNQCTISGGTGVTINGTTTVGTDGAIFLLTKSGANTWTMTRYG